MNFPHWDTVLFSKINGINSPLLTSIMQYVSNVDNWIPFMLVLIAALLWMGRTRPHMPVGGRFRSSLAIRNPRIVLLCLILSVSIADQVAYRTKKAVGRIRPCEDTEMVDVINRGHTSGRHSFPSNHAANSSALATIISIAYPPLAPVAVLSTVTVGFSRVYLGVHYPIDVFTGWLTGILSGLFIWMLLGKALSRQGLIGFTNRFRYRQPRTFPDPGGHWEEMEFKSCDGFSLNGLFLKGGNKIAVLVHGLHSDMNALAPLGEKFNKHGFSVLLVPMRGHDGHPLAKTTGGPAEVLDVIGAIEHLVFEGFEYSNMVLFGISMGGAVVMKTAGILEMSQPGCIVSYGGFDDFFVSAQRKLGKIRFGMFKMLFPRAVRKGLENFKPLDYAVSAEETTFLSLSGEYDRITPPATGMSMAETVNKGVHYTLAEEGHPSPVLGRWNLLQLESIIRMISDYMDTEKISGGTVDIKGIIDNFPTLKFKREQEENE